MNAARSDMSDTKPASDGDNRHAASREEWERAYDEAMRWRDWQTCEILIDEREEADWWKERDRDADE